MLERVPLINRLPEGNRTLTLIIFGSVAGGTAGEKAYQIIYSSDIAKQQALRSQEKQLAGQIRVHKSDLSDQRTTQQTLIRDGAQVPTKVTDLLERDAHRIAIEQTHAATLQRQYPHPSVPAGVFDFSPFALTITSIIGVGIWNRQRQNREINRRVDQAAKEAGQGNKE